MAGFCGWSRTEAVPTGEIDAIRAARRALTSSDDHNGSELSGERYCLLHSGRVAVSAIREDDDASAIVFGSVVSADQRMRARFAENGPAASILDAYRQEGPRAFESLSGAFAIAIVLREGDEIVLATDQVGTIPVHYVSVDDRLTFATTLRALKALPFLSLDPDPQSLFQYLYFHAIPTPYTAYRDVYKLPARSWLHWKSGRIETSEYRQVRWSPDDISTWQSNDPEERFFQTLDSVVAQSVGEDEEAGFFLSGGTDSSTLAGVSAKRLSLPTRTYSIGFDEPGYDEMSYARVASSHFGTEHNEYYVTKRDVAELIPRICEAYGEPFGNSSAVPTYFCALMAGKDGVSRMVAGDGGDELFGGNSRYSDQLVFSYYDRMPGAFKSVLRPVSAVLPLSVMPLRKVRRYVEQAEVRMPLRMFTYNHLRMLEHDRVLTPEFLESVDPQLPDADLTAVYDSASAENMIDRMLALDLKFTITDNDLPKVVTMCELAGREVVFPFLMWDMIELSTRVPPEQKVQRGKLRIFFKHALRNFLPAEILTKQKHGFGLPFGKWLAQDDELRQIASECLNGLAQRGILRTSFTQDLLTRRLDEHSAYYGGFAWVLIQLELWFRYHESNSLNSK